MNSKMCRFSGFPSDANHVTYSNATVLPTNPKAVVAVCSLPPSLRPKSSSGGLLCGMSKDSAQAPSLFGSGHHFPQLSHGPR